MCDDADHQHRDHHHVAHEPLRVPEELGAYRGEVLGLEPVDAVTITTLVDNSSDMLLADTGPAHRVALGSGPASPNRFSTTGRSPVGMVAEHGFSALVEVTTSAGEVRRILFDTGISPDGMVENMARLDLDPGDIEVVVCSHGHFDHTMGFDGLARRLGRRNLPVVIHPAFWSQRRLAFPGREPFELPSPSRRAMEDAGFEIVERPDPSFLLGGSVLITGEVARTTDFEQGFPFHEALADGEWRPDPLILDDQALVVHVRDQGLVVLTGCGHAGIVNITRYARHLTGIDKVFAVIGGFHLGGVLFEPHIGPTVDGLAALAPKVVVPAHCTGWRAQHALAGRLPDAFVPNAVGTRFELRAA
jgi:7,8-dihydropterin-6-yl-methyl-4-(beta-D-ribofuranosyl)aminobenzene 5'-phosphate synthase